jgi:DeoR family transcriptional regulator, aga operon transcriptional repressor
MQEPAADSGLKYTSAPERRGRLMLLVEEQGFCAISELSAALEVSEMTVRRDVLRLTNEGKLRSVHGGVTTLAQGALVGSGDYRDRAGRMAGAKRAIAARAATLVGPGDIVAIDAGTTALELTRQLVRDQPVTVVTQSVPVMAMLLDSPHARMIGLGGELHHETQSLAGPAAISSLANLRVDRLFLAASGITSKGVYCGNDFDAVTKRALIDIADDVVLIADSSKFRSSSMVRVCALTAINRVVMDDGLTAAEQDLLRAAGISLTIVHPERDRT